jgi:hypothetical protein
MSAKHTPGPWKLRKEWRCSEFALEVFHPNRKIEKPFLPAALAVVSDSVDECKANARLISAAPDLLAALKGVINVADRDTIEFKSARKAIAKAEGKEAAQ